MSSVSGAFGEWGVGLVSLEVVVQVQVYVQVHVCVLFHGWRTLER